MAFICFCKYIFHSSLWYFWRHTAKWRCCQVSVLPSPHRMISHFFLRPSLLKRISFIFLLRSDSISFPPTSLWPFCGHRNIVRALSFWPLHSISLGCLWSINWGLILPLQTLQTALDKSLSSVIKLSKLWYQQTFWCVNDDLQQQNVHRFVKSGPKHLC